MRRVESAALLVRSVAYGESDLVATFFTETDGKMGAIVRGARRSNKRFAGGLEPIHELAVILEDKDRDLGVLKEARIARARIRLTGDLEAMETAGRALRWVRHACPARTPEPGVWAASRDLLDALDREPTRNHASELGLFGLRLLADVGYGFDFEQCVRCGRVCPEGKPAYVDAAAGGLVCSSCGGARRTIGAELRSLVARALRGEGERVVPSESDAKELVAIVEDAMAAHTDFDGTKRK